jgi:hypothetical protein
MHGHMNVKQKTIWSSSSLSSSSFPVIDVTSLLRSSAISLEVSLLTVFRGYVVKQLSGQSGTFYSIYMPQKIPSVLL